MRILLVSDTHGDSRALRSVIKKVGGSVQMLVHLGDGADDLEDAFEEGGPLPPAYTVKGNMDSGWGLQPLRELWAYDRKILAAHGHLFLGGDSYRPLIETAREREASAFFFGHTHIPFWDRMNGVLLVNPGSLARPRGGFGPSFAIVEAPPAELGLLEVKIYELQGSYAHPRFRAIRP